MHETKMCSGKCRWVIGYGYLLSSRLPSKYFPDPLESWISIMYNKLTAHAVQRSNITERCRRLLTAVKLLFPPALILMARGAAVIVRSGFISSLKERNVPSPTHSCSLIDSSAYLRPLNPRCIELEQSGRSNQSSLGFREPDFFFKHVK